jgi:hypothetical protein
MSPISSAEKTTDERPRAKIVYTVIRSMDFLLMSATLRSPEGERILDPTLDQSREFDARHPQIFKAMAAAVQGVVVRSEHDAVIAIQQRRVVVRSQDDTATAMAQRTFEPPNGETLDVDALVDALRSQISGNPEMVFSGSSGKIFEVVEPL